ncbi:hypothetical protein ACQAYK_11730 [Acidithiobacillus sp. AC3]
MRTLPVVLAQLGEMVEPVALEALELLAMEVVGVAELVERAGRVSMA